MKRELMNEEQERRLWALWLAGKWAVDAAKAVGTDEDETVNLFLKWDTDLERVVAMIRKAKKEGAL